jgi:hypothetical protein
MTKQEKEIRDREAATAYVRGTESKDRTALIALLDAERVKTAALLAALKLLLESPAVGLETNEPADIHAYETARIAVAIAEGR